MISGFLFRSRFSALMSIPPTQEAIATEVPAYSQRSSFFTCNASSLVGAIISALGNNLDLLATFLFKIFSEMANPNATVACVTGEASIQMCIQELATCKQYRLSPKIILLNNRYLGMVRQWQQVDYGSRYSESYMDSLPSFDKLAESFGHVGITISKSEDIEGVLRDAFSMKDKLVFMNFITDQEENVWPMVKAGKGLTEMLLGSEDL